MLPKTYRISPHLFFTQPSRSDRYRTPLFSVRTRKGDGPHPHIVVVVKKKLDKRAVLRNRTKRLLISTVQDNVSLFPKTIDMLFLPNKIFQKSDKEEIEKCIKIMISQISRKEK